MRQVGELRQSRPGQRCPVEVEVAQVLERLDVHEPGVGHLGPVERQDFKFGQSLKMLQRSVRHGGVPKDQNVEFSQVAQDLQARSP